MNLEFWGLVLNFIGSSILVFVSLFGNWYQKDYSKPWYKRYWWMGWRPIFRVHPPNEKSKWMIKLTHKAIVDGFIPPTHLWNTIGFLFTTLGFLLQLNEIPIN
jgi:hypothetical protein